MDPLNMDDGTEVRFNDLEWDAKVCRARKSDPRTEAFEGDRVKLTVGELIELEKLSGSTIGEMDKEDHAMSMVELAALVFIHQRRANPALTFDDVLAYEADELGEKAQEFEDAVSADPTEAPS